VVAGDGQLRAAGIPGQAENRGIDRRGHLPDRVIAAAVRADETDLVATANVGDGPFEAGPWALGASNVNSIDTGNNDRDQHLRSPDFFDVDNYPTMTFRSTRIELKGDNEFRVFGDLTIHGTTREIAWDVEAAEPGKDPWGNPRLGFGAETKLNRKDFGLNWNVALETGSWLVSDEIRILAEIQAVPSTEDAAETVEGEMETHTA